MKINKQLLSEIHLPLKIIRRPFKKTAEKFGLTEPALLTVMKEYKKKEIIRRFGAVLNHRKIGFRANALVCWKIDGKRLSSVIKKITDLKQISHCYQRVTYPDWPYNLYTMIHSENKRMCLETITDIAAKIKGEEYKILFTRKEFKKTRQTFEYAGKQRFQMVK